MTSAMFAKAVEAARSLGHLRKLALYMQGDPLTDRGLEDRIPMAATLDADYMELSTNADLLDESRCQSLVRALRGARAWVHVSFHGTTRKEYEAVTGLNFAETWTNALRFFKQTEGTGIRRTLSVAVGDAMAVRRWYAGQFSGWREPPTLRLFRPCNRAGQVYGAPRVKSNPEEFLRCPRLREWVHVDWRGRVVLCCNDYTRAWSFGDVWDEGGLAAVRSHVQEVAEGWAEQANFPCRSCDLRC